MEKGSGSGVFQGSDIDSDTEWGSCEGEVSKEQRYQATQVGSEMIEYEQLAAMYENLMTEYEVKCAENEDLRRAAMNEFNREGEIFLEQLRNYKLLGDEHERMVVEFQKLMMDFEGKCAEIAELVQYCRLMEEKHERSNDDYEQLMMECQVYLADNEELRRFTNEQIHVNNNLQWEIGLLYMILGLVSVVVIWIT